MAVHDKHGTELKKGDHVEFVHFGEHHVAPVEEVSEENGHGHVHASVKVKVPAAGCTRREPETAKRHRVAHVPARNEPKAHAAVETPGAAEARLDVARPSMGGRP